MSPPGPLQPGNLSQGGWPEDLGKPAERIQRVEVLKNDIIDLHVEMPNGEVASLQIRAATFHQIVLQRNADYAQRLASARSRESAQIARGEVEMDDGFGDHSSSEIGRDEILEASRRAMPAPPTLTNQNQLPKDKAWAINPPRRPS